MAPAFAYVPAIGTSLPPPLMARLPLTGPPPRRRNASDGGARCGELLGIHGAGPKLTGVAPAAEVTGPNLSGGAESTKPPRVAELRRVLGATCTGGSTYVGLPPGPTWKRASLKKCRDGGSYVTVVQFCPPQRRPCGERLRGRASAGERSDGLSTLAWARVRVRVRVRRALDAHLGEGEANGQGMR